MVKKNVAKVWSWEEAITKSDLKPFTRLVLLILRTFMNSKGGGCFPSVSTISKASGMSRSSVISHINIAVERGFVSKTSRKKSGQEWSSNIYTLRFPPEFQLKTSADIDELACSEPNADFIGGGTSVTGGGIDNTLGVVVETDTNRPIINKPNNKPIKNNIDSDSSSLNLYNKIINHYNSVLSLKSLNWTKCQSASKNKTVSERLSKELGEFGYDFIIAAIDKLSETKYGVSIAGQGKYPKITLFFILTKLEKINSDGYAEMDKPTPNTSLDKEVHPDVQALFDLYNSSVEGRAAHSATSITPKLHQDILNAIELYGMDELKRHIPVVCQNDYFNGENQNNDDGRVWLGSIGYFFREDKIGLIMEDKQYGDPNKVKTPNPKLPKGQQVSDSRFERGLRYFVETGSWDDFSFGPEPKKGLDKRLSKLTDAQYEKYLAVI